MKTHLPKKLLVALLAAITSAEVHARVCDAATTVTVPSSTEVTVDTVAELNDSVNDVSVYSPYVKLGEGILTIDGITKDESAVDNSGITINVPLYVCEGELNISSSTIMLNPGTISSGGSTPIQIAGKDAKMSITDSTVSNMTPTSLVVGGANGSGELYLKDSYLENNNKQTAQGLYLIIGDNRDETAVSHGSNSHSLRIAGTKYEGYYTQSSVEGNDGTEYGKGKVTVDNSTYNVGSLGISLNEGEMHIINASTVTAGHYAYATLSPTGSGAWADSALGEVAYSTSKLVISGDSKLIFGSDLRIGGNTGVDATVSIDDASLELESPNTTTYFGYFADDDEYDVAATCTFELKNGATANLQKTIIKPLATVDVEIDSTSQLKASDMIIEGTTTIQNSGLIEASGDVQIRSGSVGLNGDSAVLAANEMTLNSGAGIKITDNGNNREKAYVKVNNSLTLSAGSTIILSFSDAYLSTVTADSDSTYEVYFADAGLLLAHDSSYVTELGVQWKDASEITEDVRGGKIYLKGSLLAVSDIVVDTANADISEDITDVADGTKRSITVKDATVTLSGDNTHTGGTTINNASVTLESATALGAGAVSTSGTSSITAADGVEAVLPGAIANKDGELTLNGTFDASALKPEVIGETYLGTDLTPGDNGFYQDKGSSVQVVENGEDGVLSPDSDATIKHGNREYILNTDTGMAIAPGEIDWSVYHMNTSDHEAKVSEIIEASKDAQGDARLREIQMSTGTLDVNQSVRLMPPSDINENGEIVARPVINVSGGDTELSGMIDSATMHASGGTISAFLYGDTSLTVTGDVEITGENSQTGDTIITGPDAKLTIGSDTALGASTVKLQNHATLDLNSKAANNMIEVTGCTVANADAYVGRMEVASDMKFVGKEPASAGCISLRDKGAITAKSLSTTTLEALPNKGADGYNEHTISGDVTIKENGAIILYSGKQITLTRGSLTLGNGVAMVLLDAGGEFAVGDILVTCDSGTITGDFSELDFLVNNEEQEGYRVEITEDRKSVVLAEEDKPIVGPGEDEEDKPIVDPGEDEEDKPIVGPDVPVQPEPAPVFEQATADVLAQGNWGIFTASRAFVNAVQGQRNNMGCIANGRGTAWAALLGATHDIDGSGAAAGSDTTLFGAAVGVDMQIGKRSSLGVAFGYTDAEVKPGGLADVDQEGGYIALYGEHGLKKFANNSCLALDWVLSTGTTESSYLGADWEQDHIQANTRLTWTKKVNERFAYNVFGGVEYFASESDRVAGCKSGSIQNLRGELGVGARYVVKQGQTTSCDGKGGLTPAAPGCDRIVVYGELSYINDMVRNNPSIEVNGLRGGGANPGRQGVGIEAGATFRIGERWSANANYSFNAMDDSNEHVLNIGASRTF